MKKKKLYLVLAIAIIIIIIITILIIVWKNPKKQNTNTSVEEAPMAISGPGEAATDETIDKKYNLEKNDINEEVDTKIQDTEKFYKDLKKYAFQKGLVQADTITLGQYQENEDEVIIEYYLEKEGEVQQRIIATINKQDNTYTFEYYM